jgi:hypothetical protein
LPSEGFTVIDPFGLEQFGCTTTALAFGTIVFELTTTISEAVQLLFGSVAVTVYVFAVFMVLVAVLIPLLHVNVTPAVDEVA